MTSKPYRYAAVAAGFIAVAVLFTMPGEAYGQEGDSGPAVMKDIGTGPGLDASATPEILKHVGIEQRIGVSLPLDLEFNDETGTPVSLGSYFGDKPVILTLVYYDCPMLCTEVLNGLNRSLAPLNYSIGEEFEVVTVSFDPRESPTLASQKKAVYTQRYGRPGTGEGWHFLTGEAAAIDALTESVGFNYVYDETEGQFVHGSAIMIISPKGTVSHYFFGIEYPSEDIRLAIIESSEEKLGNVFDQIMLYCFNYDPEQGRYGVAIMNAMRLAGLVTLLAMGSFMVVMFKRDRRRRRERIERGEDA
ncbi:MAG: SCO family protein [Gemmatimonadetes bacterium]|nr:SCO family protein [Gemmatimonadota bacterium]MYG85223.1 SCO family protein [Gemmatimonadota bacterium]MYJ91231.1 SCO family protein [Gemmatimonadota bacterium]